MMKSCLDGSILRAGRLFSVFVLLLCFVAMAVSSGNVLGQEPAADELELTDASHGDGDHVHLEADHDADAERAAGEHGAGEHGAGEHGAGEHGAGHDEPTLLSFDVGSAIWNLVIFLVVLAVLSKFVWPSVLHGLQAREEKIREDLASAEKANADAKALLAKHQAKLNEASSQAQAMLAEARRDAENAGQKIIEEAKLEAAAQRDRAVADIENAKKVAMADLAGQTSALAMQVARGVVGRELTPADHADLIRQAMENMPSQN